MARPKSTGNEALQTVTMRIEKGILNKIAYIAWFDRRSSKKAVVSDALDDLITKWEKEHGVITEAQVTEMEKALAK